MHATCRSLVQEVLKAYLSWPQITTTTKWKRKKTRKNTRFIKNIQLLFIIKKPNNNRLCFYFICSIFRFQFQLHLKFEFIFFWFALNCTLSLSSSNGFRINQSTFLDKMVSLKAFLQDNMVSPTVSIADHEQWNQCLLNTYNETFSYTCYTFEIFYNSKRYVTRIWLFSPFDFQLCFCLFLLVFAI